MTPKLLTKKEAAQALRCSVRQINRFIDKHALDFTRIGTRVLIYEDSVNALIDDGDPKKSTERLLSE